MCTEIVISWVAIIAVCVLEKVKLVSTSNTLFRDMNIILHLNGHGVRRTYFCNLSPCWTPSSYLNPLLFMISKFITKGVLTLNVKEIDLIDLISSIKTDLTISYGQEIGRTSTMVNIARWRYNITLRISWIDKKVTGSIRVQFIDSGIWLVNVVVQITRCRYIFQPFCELICPFTRRKANLDLQSGDC